METRFTDDIDENTDGSDFIVRKRRPFAVQILLVFLMVCISIYLAAVFVDGAGGGALFSGVLVFTIGLLGWFTIYLTQRNRDLVMATEFQNAMLASAAQLSTRFCIITKRDGTIVYIDPGFQKTFPHFISTGSHTVDGLLMSAEVPEDIYKQISKTLEKQAPLSITIPFKSPTGKPMPMVVAIDLLPRPRGYFLFRGRDYVEKRQAAEGPMALTEPPQQTSLYSAAVRALPGAAVLFNANYEVMHASPLFEALLGYDAGELQATKQRYEHLCYQYEGHPAAKIVNGDFEGAITLHRKDRSLMGLYGLQRRLQGNESGLLLLVEPLEGAKKKLAEIDAPAQAAVVVGELIASSPIAVARISETGEVIECNDALRNLTKYKVTFSGWKFIELVREDSRAEVSTQIERILGGQAPAKKPLDLVLASDESVTVSLYLSRMGDQIIAQLIDTSEQKSLEQRFAHSQKMQAVGQLAGGVAHDFNNLLTAMIGFCDLLLMRHPAGDQSFADIMQVKQNANRAANLVRQLLAFSRRQTLQPKMLDITDVLAELSNLVRRLIGENIELKMTHGRDLGVVKADQGQLEQVFINLAVNARDAMQKGGKLTIQTSHVTIDRANPIARNLMPPLEEDAIVDGDYVLVEVIDTGTGIPRALLQKIFEPFFSTKEVGSGTGLGLATVYGIVKQTGGYIYVSSTEGKGTNFSLFFKRFKHEENTAAVEQEQTQVPASDDLTGKGTILLVEDETPVRTFAARALRNKGYTVLEADCGENAVEVMEAQGSEVDVVISDVIMPGMNGPTMIETIAPKFPRVKVIFISGYAEDIFVQNYGSEREFNFLPKPFTLKQLASKVKEVMAK